MKLFNENKNNKPLYVEVTEENGDVSISLVCQNGVHAVHLISIRDDGIYAEPDAFAVMAAFDHDGYAIPQFSFNKTDGAVIFENRL